MGDENRYKQNIIICNTIFAVLGAFGNISAVLVLAFGKHNKNPCNVLLLNLAVADLGVLLVAFPVWAVKILIPYRWPFGGVMCKVLSASMNLFHVVSLATIVAIAIVRYRTIVHTIDNRQCSAKYIKIAIVFVWLFCFCTASIPQIVSQTFFEQKYTVGNVSNSMQFCFDMELGVFNKVDTVLGVFVWYLVPLLVTLVTFLRIHMFLKRHAQKIETHQSVSRIRSRIKSYHKVTRMLGAVVFSFAVLMLPWNIIKLLNVVFEKHIDGIYNLVAGTLLILSSCLNPVIYYLMAAEFRSEFKRQVLEFKKRICKTVLRCHENSDRGHRENVKVRDRIDRRHLLLESQSRTTEEIYVESSVSFESRDKCHPLNQNGAGHCRKQSMMDGKMNQSITEVVNTLERKNSKLEETFI